MDKKEPLPLDPTLGWAVEINSLTCIVFAATKAKANWIAVRSYWEAYGKNGWPSSQVARRPQYDHHYLSRERSRAWSEDFVKG